MERLTHQRVNGIKTGYWSAATKEVLVQRLAAFEDEAERRTARPRTIFEQITASPEVLGGVLAMVVDPECPIWTSDACVEGTGVDCFVMRDGNCGGGVDCARNE